MKQGKGKLVELYLESGLIGGRLLCSQNLIPAPGQYALAYNPASYDPLPVPIFNAGYIPGGILIAPPIPPSWQPGATLSLRGPFGHGFSMPSSARRVALVTLGDTSGRLKPLLTAALEQEALVVLISELDIPELPSEVEIQPFSACAEVAHWADYMAFDVPRELISELSQKFGVDENVGVGRQAQALSDAQVLVTTPMPCGGIAECGVCAASVRHGWKLTCKHGPVLNLVELN